MSKRSEKTKLPENARPVSLRQAKKQRRPRAEAKMMGPVWIGVIFLAVVCIGLAIFLLNPIW